MSVVSGRLGQTKWSAGSGRPGYPALLSATLRAQVFGGLALWLASLGLAFVGAAPGGGSVNPFLPWQIDGPWALVATAGWAYLVSRLIAGQLVDRLAARGPTAPSRGWCAVAVAIGGYGALALGHSTGNRVLLAVVITPLVVGAVAYAPDGQPRSWPVPADRRVRATGVVIALLIVLAYAAPHPLSVDGSGGSYASGVNRLAPGQTVEVDFPLGGHLLPMRLTGVTVAGGVQVRSTMLSGSPGASAGDRLPVQLAGGQWVSVHVGLSCPAAPTTIRRATLHYRVLGIATSQTIALQDPARLACRR